MQARNASGFLQKTPALLWFGIDDRTDPALADQIEKLKRTLPELKRKLASAHDKRFNEATKLKSLTDKVCCDVC